MRASIGGCVAKICASPDSLEMPNAFTESGRPPVCRPPSRRSAAIIGCGVPSSLAEPRSARNSRSRENQATIAEARMPNTIWETIIVM